MSEGFNRTVEAFCAAEPRLGTAKGAFNHCLGAASRLSRLLREEGFEACVLRLAECTARYPDADRRWRDLGSEFYWIHYAVLVGDTVVDVTARQFDPSAPFPSLRPVAEVMDEWEDVTEVDPKTRSVLKRLSRAAPAAP